ncbi:MAG TPA: SDR family oxidoreductase [Candidatus Corynebacterium avicola]|uniref:SDR family oxidoreductase n=1 Tax=Candidatus Corynebacterium avicola TaxID=2838527 RepID=A0A9D1RR20_9CORY|nr:SDR family oxidoreductase [Candidatus Corynebacterium avicola]
MTIIVTGAAGGIGRAVVDALAEDGTSSTILAVDLPGSDWPEHTQPSVRRHEADLSIEADVEALFVEAEASGPVTGLAHVAGVFTLTSLTDTTLEQFERIHRVNSAGTFLLLREVARRMADKGSVVTVTSNAARVPRAGMGAYGSSKAAATQLTRIAGLELADRGIRANAVCPGSTDTAMQRGMWGDDPEGGRRAVLAGDPAAHRVGIPLGRIADPQDVAEVVTFLLSEKARHVTMQEIFVDGGASLGP